MTPGELLLSQRLVVGGESLRVVEVERYWHSAEHPDPYPHKHPLQLTSGKWAFHRVGSGYRGGTYKGLDLTCGDGTAFGGILLRAVENEHGRTDGPSRVVDRLLRSSGQKSVAELERLIAGRAAVDPTSPLRLVRVETVCQPMYRTARVGLSFADEHLGFWALPERYLLDPRRTRTGRPQLVVALAVAGMRRDDIVRTTGSPVRAVDAYLAAFERGRAGEPPATGDVGSLLTCHRLGRAGVGLVPSPLEGEG